MDTIERNGRTWRVWIEDDDCNEPPWERADGHGPVSDWTARDKKPGERVLNEDHGSKRYYDFAEAVRIAKVDGWDAPPYGQGTPKQRAARAAEADFARLRAWCNDEWNYIGVVVAPVCKCCGHAQRDYTHALWGIESDSPDYHETVACELIDQAGADAKPACGCEDDGPDLQLRLVAALRDAVEHVQWLNHDPAAADGDDDNLLGQWRALIAEAGGEPVPALSDDDDGEGEG